MIDFKQLDVNKIYCEKQNGYIQTNLLSIKNLVLLDFNQPPVNQNCSYTRVLSFICPLKRGMHNL